MRCQLRNRGLVCSDPMSGVMFPCQIEKCSARRAGAFSLLEVSMVLAIIGLLAAIAVPRYANFVTGHRADAAARRVKADLAMVREYARVSSQSRTISFDTALDKYFAAGVPDPENAGSDYAVYLSAEPYLASIVSADFGGVPDLTYDGYGVPTAAGTIVVRVGSHQRTISIDPTANAPAGDPIQRVKVVQ